MVLPRSESEWVTIFLGLGKAYGWSSIIDLRTMLVRASSEAIDELMKGELV